MAHTLTLETTVVQRETGRIADILFVPAESLLPLGIQEPLDLAGELGCNSAWRCARPKKSRTCCSPRSLKFEDNFYAARHDPKTYTQ